MQGWSNLQSYAEYVSFSRGSKQFLANFRSQTEEKGWTLVGVLAFF